jgi:hypothetical protein
MPFFSRPTGPRDLRMPSLRTASSSTRVLAPRLLPKRASFSNQAMRSFCLIADNTRFPRYGARGRRGYGVAQEGCGAR